MANRKDELLKLIAESNFPNSKIELLKLIAESNFPDSMTELLKRLAESNFPDLPEEFFEWLRRRWKGKRGVSPAEWSLHKWVEEFKKWQREKEGSSK